MTASDNGQASQKALKKGSAKKELRKERFPDQFESNKSVGAGQMSKSPMPSDKQPCHGVGLAQLVWLKYSVVHECAQT